MGETEILSELKIKLKIEDWWKDLIGQPAVYDSFDMEAAWETLPRTEVKAAAEIHRKFRNLISYSETGKRWYIWDGRIHVPCEGDGIATKVAKLYYEAMCDALSFVQSAMKHKANEIQKSSATGAQEAAKYMAHYEKGEFAKHRSFRDRVSTDSGLSALIRLMRTECDVPNDYYDNDRDWFVMRNCVLDLKKLRDSSVYRDESKLVFDFLPHDPSRPVTKFFDADANFTMNNGDWDTFLTRSIPDEESRNYLQIIVGAAMMGTSKLRVIANLMGPPHSGKSVFIETMFALGNGGAGYACMPESKSITKVTGQNFDQDSFRGRRFIGISEPSAGDKIDDDFLKRFTGDVWVETRTLNVKSSGWCPQGVIFGASNGTFKINTRDQAIVDRVQVIEFPIHFELPMPGVYIPEERRAVEGIEELILADRSRILTWILIGMRKFVMGGSKLHPPAAVLAKRDEVVTDASTALRWVEEYVEDGLVEVDYTVPAMYCIPIKDAYIRYVNWAAQAGEKRPLTRRFFTQDIEKRYNSEAVKCRHDGEARFFGLKVTQKYQMLYGAGDRQSVDGG